MNDIKQYKPLALVFYIDWNWDRNALPLDDSKREAFKKAVETSKMVELEWITINTFDIKEIRPAEKTTEIEKLFYSQSWDIRTWLNWRAKKLAQDQGTDAVEYFTACPDREFALRRLREMIESRLEYLSNKQD
jgi:hypothetical protein